MADKTTHRKTFLQGVFAAVAALLLWTRKPGDGTPRVVAAAPPKRTSFPVEARKAPRAIERGRSL